MTVEESILQDKQKKIVRIVWTPQLKKIIKDVIIGGNGYKYLSAIPMDKIDEMLDIFEEAGFETTDGVRTAMGFTEIELSENSPKSFIDIVRTAISHSAIYWANGVGRDLI